MDKKQIDRDKKILSNSLHRTLFDIHTKFDINTLSPEDAKMVINDILSKRGNEPSFELVSKLLERCNGLITEVDDHVWLVCFCTYDLPIEFLNKYFDNITWDAILNYMVILFANDSFVDISYAKKIMPILLKNFNKIPIREMFLKLPNDKKNKISRDGSNCYSLISNARIRLKYRDDMLHIFDNILDYIEWYGILKPNPKINSAGSRAISLIAKKNIIDGERVYPAKPEEQKVVNEWNWEIIAENKNFLCLPIELQKEYISKITDNIKEIYLDLPEEIMSKVNITNEQKHDIMKNIVNDLF